MLDSGILRDAEGLELIDGLLVYKDRATCGADPMTIGEKHNLVIKLLARLDPELVVQGAHMQTQGPVRVSDRDEPEPDGAVVRGDPRDYADRIPTSRDVTCVLEVADSSLEYDRTIKMALYANAGISQYVIVNLRDLCLEVRESPAGGQYADLRIVAAGDTVELSAVTEMVRVPAARILP
jgi:Uma2 family endonuclease